MISIEYKNNEIEIKTEELPSYVNAPLTAKIVNPITNKVIWQTNELNSNCWAKFPNTEIFSTLIFDRFDNLLWQRAWSVQENGSNLYKKFFYYLLNLKKDKRPKGVAIGTHNGEFGEWVPSVVSDHTDAILVEASNKQFLELEQNYSNKNNVTLLNLLVTKDGKPTKYWEGGRGYTNSIVKRVPEKQETEPIKDTIYPSTNINKLVNESVDWLHLDVEGYDHILIKSLNYLPDFIIFEWENLLTNELDDIKKYLKDKGFTLDFENNVSCLAIKNN